MPEPTRLHPAPLIGQLPAGILLWAAVAFTISFCCFRFSQVDASVLLLVLAPLLWLPAMPALRLRDGGLECFVMLALVWQVWMIAVQALVPAALPCGWWRVAEHAAALATCLFLAVRRDEPRDQLRLFGTGAAAAALLAVGVSGYDGLISSLQTACFGFGHVNVLMNTAGPALLAWLVLCAHDWRGGRRPSARDLTILAVGLGCLLVLAIGTGRRGILVAYGAAAAWFLWRHLLARSAAVGWSVALLAVALAGAFAWHVATADLVSGRLERINIYHSAWEGAQASFPWGYGYYGALHLQWLDTEHARHLTATGGWGMHAHNEFLDTLLDGGPVALVLLCALLALLAQRVWCLRDPGLRAAWQAAGVAIGVHLMTDNCYGTTVGLIWAAVAAGLIFAAPTTRLWVRHGLLPKVRLLMWPLVAVASWGATRTLYPAVLHKDAFITVRVQCLAQALEPQTVDLHARTLLSGEWENLHSDGQRQVIAAEVGKLGWTGMLAVTQARWALEAGSADDQLEAFLRVLRFTPFDRGSYEHVAVIVAARPALSARLPPALSRRLAYLSGRRGLPVPAMAAVPATMDAAADMYAAISWSIATGRPWQELDAPLLHLVHAYGDTSGVALLALRCAAAAPPGTFPWLDAEGGTLGFGLRFAQAEACAEFEQATSAVDIAAAHALQPLAWNIWRDVIRDCENGTDTHPAGSDEEVRSRVAAVRLWGRLRVAGLAPPVDPGPRSWH